MNNDSRVLTAAMPSFEALSFVRDDVMVEWDFVGEGFYGDYDPDPSSNDLPLLRFSVYVRINGEWVAVEDASYCTMMSVNVPKTVLQKALEYIMDEVYEPLSQGYSVKKLCERLSWITQDWFGPIKEETDGKVAVIQPGIKDHL